MPGRSAVVALVASLGLIVASGWHLLWPAAVAVGAALYLRRRAARDTAAARVIDARPCP